MPKPPPASVNMVDELAAPLSAAYSAHASMRKARSSVKKSMKNMMVERSVQSRRMVVKMNQPVRKKPRALSPILGSAPEAASVLASYGPPVPKMFQFGVRRTP